MLTVIQSAISLSFQIKYLMWFEGGSTELGKLLHSTPQIRISEEDRKFPKSF